MCLAYSEDSQVKFLQGENSFGEPIQCEQVVKTIHIHHNRMYIACEESLILIYENGALVKTIEEEDTICVSTNNGVFITGSQHEITVWDGITFKRRK